MARDQLVRPLAQDAEEADDLPVQVVVDLVAGRGLAQQHARPRRRTARRSRRAGGRWATIQGARRALPAVVAERGPRRRRRRGRCRPAEGLDVSTYATSSSGRAKPEPSGYWCQTTPSSARPPAFGVGPPCCLQENAVPAPRALVAESTAATRRRAAELPPGLRRSTPAGTTSPPGRRRRALHQAPRRAARRSPRRRSPTGRPAAAAACARAAEPRPQVERPEQRLGADEAHGRRDGQQLRQPAPRPSSGSRRWRPPRGGRGRRRSPCCGEPRLEEAPHPVPAAWSAGGRCAVGRRRPRRGRGRSRRRGTASQKRSVMLQTKIRAGRAPRRRQAQRALVQHRRGVPARQVGAAVAPQEVEALGVAGGARRADLHARPARDRPSGPGRGAGSRSCPG